MPSIDIREYALKLLGLSSKFLVEDGDLDPTAFIITAVDQILRPLELYDEASKLNSCKGILAEARKLNALAIITVFLARYKDSNDQGFDEMDYVWGDIQRDNTQRCILMTLSGPGIKNWAAAIPFKNDGDTMVLGERVEFADGVYLGLFPGWAEETNPRAS